MVQRRNTTGVGVTGISEQRAQLLYRLVSDALQVFYDATGINPPNPPPGSNRKHGWESQKRDPQESAKKVPPSVVPTNSLLRALRERALLKNRKGLRKGSGRLAKRLASQRAVGSA